MKQNTNHSFVRFLLITMLPCLLAACQNEVSSLYDATENSASDDLEQEPESLDSREYDQLFVSIDGDSSELIDFDMSLLPTSTSSSVSLPKIISYPQNIKSLSGRREQLDFLFESSGSVNKVYVHFDDQPQAHQFTPSLPNLDRPLLVTNSSESTSVQTVSVDIDIPENVSSLYHCLSVFISDQENNLSIPVSTCIYIVEETEGRLPQALFLADFDLNSKIAVFDYTRTNSELFVETDLQITDIAYLNDKIYAITFNDIFEIDVSTGELKKFNSLSSQIHRMNGLTAYKNKLYIISVGGDFASMDPVSGQLKRISLLPEGWSSSGDLAVDPIDRRLWASVGSPILTTDHLIKLDPVTGAANMIGNIGYKNVWCIEYYRNQLIGFTNIGEKLLINPETGEGFVIDTINIQNIAGVAAMN